MTSRHLVDSELAPGLDFLPNFRFSDDALPGLREKRQEMFLAASAKWPETPHIERREVIIPATGSSPAVRVLTYRRKASATRLRGAYLHLHGGGFVMSTSDMCERQNVALVEALDCVVVSVDYRLAPETRFPGNIEDCYAALRWLHDNCEAFGIDPASIAVAGESAGGGLAAALSLLARDRGEVVIAHQHLLYPMLDDRLPSVPNPYTGEFNWSAESNNFGWRALLGHELGRGDVSPYAVPGRAQNLENLPPAFIAIGSLDLLVEQGVDYALRLLWAGVPAELHVYAGAFHGSEMLMPAARISQQFTRDRLDALRGVFGEPEEMPSQ